MRQTACARRSLAGMIGGGTWEGASMFDMRRREFEYRIKSASEEHERVALESELTKA